LIKKQIVFNLDFFLNDDDFNWNYGIALGYCGDYKSAEEALQLVKNETYKTNFYYFFLDFRKNKTEYSQFPSKGNH